jgi:hypothetical protein
MGHPDSSLPAVWRRTMTMAENQQKSWKATSARTVRLNQVTPFAPSLNRVVAHQYRGSRSGHRERWAVHIGRLQNVSSEQGREDRSAFGRGMKQAVREGWR